MEYLTSAECAEKWNVSQRGVAIYCKEGRIEGAIMMGRNLRIHGKLEKIKSKGVIYAVTIFRRTEYRIPWSSI